MQTQYSGMAAFYDFALITLADNIDPSVPYLKISNDYSEQSIDLTTAGYPVLLPPQDLLLFRRTFHGCRCCASPAPPKQGLLHGAHVQLWRVVISLLANPLVDAMPMHHP